MFEALAMALLLDALASALESATRTLHPKRRTRSRTLANGHTLQQAPMFANGRLRCEVRLSTPWVARCAALSAIIDSELARGVAELRAAGSSGTLWGWWLGWSRVGGGLVEEVRDRACMALEAGEHIVLVAEDIRGSGLSLLFRPFALFFFCHSLTSTCLADISCGIRLCV